MSDRLAAILECLYGLIYLALALLAVQSIGVTLIRWLKRERAIDGAARAGRREVEEPRVSVRPR
jgi:hypothetical protein